MSTGTSVTLHVTDDQKKSVGGALVKFIVNGLSLTNPAPQKTDANGRITFAWPANPAPHQNFPRITGDIYSCIYTVDANSATSGRLSAQLKKGQHHDLRVQIRSAQHASTPLKSLGSSSTAEERFNLRAQYEPSQRTEKELLADVAWGAETSGKLLKGTKIGLSIAKYAKHQELDAAIKAVDTLTKQAKNATSFQQIAIIDVWDQAGLVQLKYDRTFAKLTTASKAVVRLSVAATIVSGFYEINEAAEAGDGERLANQAVSMVFRLALVANPWVAGVDLILSICLGSDWPGKVVGLFVPDKGVSVAPQVVQGSLLTNMEEFKYIGSCPVVSGNVQYRIDVSKRPYGCKSYAASARVPGLAFDGGNHGQLVYVDVEGAKHPIMLTDGNARSLPTRIEYLVREGLL